MTAPSPDLSSPDPPAGKRVAILQSNYIPWKGYFDIIGSVDEFIIYDDVQYTKNDWRNRNKIKSPQGEMWLTIPVRQERLQQLIRETEISSPVWSAKHWRTIAQTYAKAPGFPEVKGLLAGLYDEAAGFRLLSEVNVHFLKAICRYLGIATTITSSGDYRTEGDRNERLIQLVRQAGGDQYLSGKAASVYLDVDLFSREGISVSWAEYEGYPEYPQMYPPFNHFVSIVDLLVSVGGEAASYLKTPPRLASVPA
jgi:hypothetical protein